MKLLSLNFQSITAKKTSSFDNLLHEHDSDIIAISETWLKPEFCQVDFYHQILMSSEEIGQMDMVEF